MTHLGLNSAAAAAAKGFSVCGFDRRADLIERLRLHQLPISEPDLFDTVRNNADRLRFTADPAELAGCDIVYIASDVPTDDDARSDLTPILSLIDGVAPTLRDDAVMVVLCQVPPGFTRAIAAIPPDRLFYQVETLIFGRAVERAMFPERIIVGVADPGKPLPPAYNQFLAAFQCHIYPMRYESAELAKIAINFCLVASVSVANTLAEISETIGADWSEIIPTLRTDKRIGPHAYLVPGLGISGGNLERDLQTIRQIGRAKGTDVGIVDAWLENSRHRKDWLWRSLHDLVLRDRPQARIAVLGLSYKENSNSTKNSPSLQLLSHLTSHPHLRVHDPVVSAACVPFATAAATPLDCAKDADILVVATPWPQFKALRLADLAEVMAGRVLIDPYRIFDPNQAQRAGFAWHSLGVAAPSLDR
jgi:UDPglucose 6-dehydrogenase